MLRRIAYMPFHLLMLMVLVSCDREPLEANPLMSERVGDCCPCPDATTAPPSSTTSAPVLDLPAPPPPPLQGVPAPTGICPDMHEDGPAIFCPDGMPCRTVVLVNGTGTTAEGPLVMHWHGTGESIANLLLWDTSVLLLRDMVDDNSGLLAIPVPDPAAPARQTDPFPWWVVCTTTDCDRPDDFLLADEIAGCAVQTGAASADRIVSSGFSAGGIMSSHLADRRNYFAAIASWSGGLPAEYQPGTFDGNTAVMALHGGAADVYCGNPCYAFQDPSEALAADAAQQGRFAFVCDHQAGHAAAMGPQVAPFLRDARLGDGHLWTGYQFGHPGTGGDWMLDNYCYPPGTASPWQ